MHTHIHTNTLMSTHIHVHSNTHAHKLHRHTHTGIYIFQMGFFVRVKMWYLGAFVHMSVCCSLSPFLTAFLAFLCPTYTFYNKSRFQMSEKTWGILFINLFYFVWHDYLCLHLFFIFIFFANDIQCQPPILTIIRDSYLIQRLFKWPLRCLNMTPSLSLHL